LSASCASDVALTDPIRHLWQAVGLGFNHEEIRNAALGYSIVRRITVANAGTLNRDAINTFLIILATFERAFQISHSRVVEIIPTSLGNT
jgi:hypothetical protein